MKKICEWREICGIFQVYKFKLAEKLRAVKVICRRRCLTVVLAGCAALGWWGALYPQFTLLSGTYEVVCEADSAKNNLTEEKKYTTEYIISQKSDISGYRQDERELYWQILSADRSQIRIKSRILEDWKALMGAGSE